MGFRDVAKADRAENVRSARGTKTEKFAGWLTDWHKPITAVAAVAALVFTGVQSCQTREHFEVGQRAWLHATEASAGTLVDGKLTPGRVVLKNTGQTAATDVTFRSNVIIGPVDWTPSDQHVSYSLHAEYWQAELRSGPGVFAPGVAMSYGPRPDGKPLPQEQVDLLTSGQHRPYLIGEAEYRDVFGHSRRTRFCYMTRDGSPLFCPFFNSVE